MGGGAAMRAAGKLTGMGVLNGGLRGGISTAQPAEQALRSVSRPAAAVVSTASSSGVDVAAIQKASSWEAEWDFAAVEEELMVETAPEPIARVVFDVPPTLQEAKDATADLKEALDKVYLSSPEYGPAFGLPFFAISDNLETKSCISRDSKSAPVQSAFNAFRLLSESPAVQSIVASIAADQKVWDAVMENPDLKEFMVSQRNNAAVEEQESARMFDESSSDSSPGGDTAGEFGDTEDPVNDFFQKVKKSVVEMVSNVSDFFQSLFGSSPSDRTSADAGGTGASVMEKTMGASLMGLAIMVITVVVLKRV
ncbi:hypothetical protein Ddye_027176 [Dipteronia dyeriana]|uniref:Uncharacterized protein n=1 Tax=Dipteronia dyeriana TaxID=168575 RepID=A0AAD9TP95_9ROSI|nr:hypothetical protein Ddye_027176 [Dipteronia dyeriana]